MNGTVPRDLVEAALAAARDHDTDVASVPVTAIAAAAGVSRSTLLRRLGGTRAALDDAVRAAGVDPGGRPPVRERAITAAAHLVDERGLGGVTLDAVAGVAGCSLPSLHTVFGGRDGLLTAVFERYSPVLDLERLGNDPPADLADTVRAIYRVLVAAFQHTPRVLPAMFADLFSRPDGPGSQMFRASFPRLFAGFDALLWPHVRVGRLRPLPLPLLIQQMLGPLAVHLPLRPALESELGTALPSLEDTCEEFTRAFLRAAALPPADTGAGTGEASPPAGPTDTADPADKE